MRPCIYQTRCARAQFFYGHRSEDCLEQRRANKEVGKARQFSTAYNSQLSAVGISLLKTAFDDRTPDYIDSTLYGKLFFFHCIYLYLGIIFCDFSSIVLSILLYKRGLQLSCLI